eukprot:991455-Pyramimonas_sp.AAC.1
MVTEAGAQARLRQLLGGPATHNSSAPQGKHAGGKDKRSVLSPHPRGGATVLKASHLSNSGARAFNIMVDKHHGEARRDHARPLQLPDAPGRSTCGRDHDRNIDGNETSHAQARRMEIVTTTSLRTTYRSQG